jgi:hypothetical protein
MRYNNKCWPKINNEVVKAGRLHDLVVSSPSLPSLPIFSGKREEDVLDFVKTDRNRSVWPKRRKFVEWRHLSRLSWRQEKVDNLS